MTEIVRIGLIGAGGMGRGHADAVRGLTNAKIVAVAETDEGRGRELAGRLGVPWIRDYHELLLDDAIDAVSIASPPFLHREMVEAAAAAKKHVFCEKPLAPTVADCEVMLAAAEQASITLMVGQVLRYLSPFLKIREIVNSGGIGTPLSAFVTRLSGGRDSSFEIPWRKRLATSGGVLMEINAHELDLLRCLCGDVASVYAEMDNYSHPDHDYCDLAFISLRFRNGAIGLLYSSTTSAIGGTSGLIQGTEGAIRYEGWGRRGRIEWKRYDAAEPVIIDLSTLEARNGYEHEFDLFAQAVLQRTVPEITGLDGLKAVELAEAAYTAGRTRQPLVLPVRS
ncbi:MAG: Gfo/Idh/MocA family oxidoreductase [Chloroflexi bacterium]|nr:Gfo/Idh/MocA family oxidoreductase [Chloroflexota bacterium]